MFPLTNNLNAPTDTCCPNLVCLLTGPQAGELVMLHVEDGAPVEYAQLVAELAPFFGGHIIGDRKYA